jgi:hypothetical protein
MARRAWKFGLTALDVSGDGGLVAVGQSDGGFCAPPPLVLSGHAASLIPY